MSDDHDEVPSQTPTSPTQQNDPILFRLISWTFLVALVVVPIVLVLAEMLLVPTIGTDASSEFEEVEAAAPPDQEVQSDKKRESESESAQDESHTNGRNQATE